MKTGIAPGRRGGIRSTYALYEVLLLAALIWFLGKFVRYAFPPLFETLQATYAVTNTQIGLAFSAFMIVYAVMQFPSGALADRFGSVSVISAGAALAGLGAAVVVIQPPFVALVALMAIIGAGTGAHKTVSIRLLSNAYPARFGRTLGVFDTIGASGGFVAPLIVAAVLGLALVEWRLLFGALGGVFLIGAVAFARRVRRSTGATSVDRSTSVLPWRTYRRTFAKPRLVLFIGVTMLMAFAYNGTVAFLPLFLIAEGGLSPAVASLLYSVLFAATFAQLLTGEAADRIGPLRTVTACLAATAIGLGSLLVVVSGAGSALTTPRWLAVAGAIVLLIGIGAHGYRPAREVYLVSLVPAATTGGAIGVVRTALMMAAAIAPAVVGYVADRSGFLVAFTILSVVAASAVVLAVIVASLHRRTSVARDDRIV